jgi:hypothetical protein
MIQACQITKMAFTLKQQQGAHFWVNVVTGVFMVACGAAGVWASVIMAANSIE